MIVRRTWGEWGKGIFACLKILVDYILHFSPSVLRLLISWHILAGLTEVRAKFGRLLGLISGGSKSPNGKKVRWKEEGKIMMSGLRRHVLWT
jgi:hypothetical protein